MARFGTYNGGGTIIAPRRRIGSGKLPAHVRPKEPEAIPPLPGPKCEIRSRKRKKGVQGGSGPSIPEVRGRPATPFEVALTDYVKRCVEADETGVPRPGAPRIVSQRLGQRLQLTLKALVRARTRKR
jgi:hypothetical protein